MGFYCKRHGGECDGCGECQEARVAMYCDGCGDEIYEYDKYYDINGEAYCEDCLEKYFAKEAEIDDYPDND